MNRKFETYLPVFSGFYNTFWEYDEDQREYENSEVDYEKYQKDIVIGICRTLPDYLSCVNSIELQEIISPREYNFANDSANVIINVDVTELRNLIFENEEYFREYIKDHYTSYDGFISHHSNSFEDWTVETERFTNFKEDSHKLGSLLTALFYLDGEEESDFAERVKELNGIYESNYESEPTWNMISDDQLNETFSNALLGLYPASWSGTRKDEPIDLSYGDVVFTVKDAKDKAAMFGGDFVEHLSRTVKTQLLENEAVTPDEILKN